MGYYIIFDWMVDGLGLQGKEVDVYAIVYGFSQDGESWFKGSKGYLAKKARCSEMTVFRALKSLKEKGLIKSQENKVAPGVVTYDYAVVLDKIPHNTVLYPITQCYTPSHSVTAYKYTQSDNSPLQPVTCAVKDTDNAVLDTKETNGTELNKRAREKSPKENPDPMEVETFNQLWIRIPLREILESGQTHDEQLKWSLPHIRRIKSESGASWEELIFTLNSVFGDKGCRNLSYWFQDNADEIISRVKKNREASLWRKF